MALALDARRIYPAHHRVQSHARRQAAGVGEDAQARAAEEMMLSSRRRPVDKLLIYKKYCMIVRSK